MQSMLAATALGDAMDEVTRALNALSPDDLAARSRLLALVYDELRRIAAAKMAGESPGHTLQPTALVHEAYLRLIGPECRWEGRGHFFAAAAEAMRRILVENARRKQAAKRGGDRAQADLDLAAVAAPVPDDDLLALDEALERFAAVEPKKAELVKLRYFAGLTIERTAEALGISTATAERWWAYARAWLFLAVRGEKTPKA
jgi:RNA polymerase sigma factor (TIGR02999 family)